MDSDSGIPYHVTFGALSLVAGTLATVEYSDRGNVDWPGFVYYFVGAALFVWSVIGTAFKYFTKHRGMAHSIPAAILCGLLTFVFMLRLSLSDAYAFLIGLAVVSGYLTHLVLDEVYAAINFSGFRFTPSSSLGSALKLFSRSVPVNIVIYGSVAGLLFSNYSELQGLAVGFFHAITER
jgi:membrane-bound metal-dependent hydrolase YbcI (DUF457 family)